MLKYSGRADLKKQEDAPEISNVIRIAIEKLIRINLALIFISHATFPAKRLWKKIPGSHVSGKFPVNLKKHRTIRTRTRATAGIQAIGKSGLLPLIPPPIDR